MKTIKVTKVQKHHAVQSGTIDVVKGKLKFIYSSEGSAPLVFHDKDINGTILINPWKRLQKSDECLLVNPIIISETEEKSVGDKVEFEGNILIVTQHDPMLDKTMMYAHYENGNGIGIHKDNFNKILALPENFSKKHLEAIVDKKLKDGDEVLVECEFKSLESDLTRPPKHADVIKFNQCDHITLFPVKRTAKMIDKLDIYSGDLNAERIKTYRELAQAYNIQEGTVRDMFCKGAEWVIDVSEREEIITVKNQQ